MIMRKLLEVKNLSARLGKQEILQSLAFSVAKGETVAILGPNGAGKSTIARALMGIGELDYRGQIVFDGTDVSGLSVDERARKGLFLSYQEPVTIPGLPLAEVLRAAWRERGLKVGLTKFQLQLAETLESLNLSAFAGTRGLNDGFSGGEKKKLELAQMMMLEPKLAILDEIDSGLDLDAARQIADCLSNFQAKTKVAYLVISHNLRVLQALKTDRVYVVKKGRLVAEGDAKLLKQVEKNGFRQIG